MQTLIVPAPAKLNLFLHVTGRRGDGYHDLESLLVTLDFGDTLTLTRRPDGRIVRANEVAGVPPETDLAVRAAKALQSVTGSSFGVDIAVEKRIPLGGGLGGGSSDAASVLLALNRLWEAGLSRDELMRIGVTLGADVPFFIFGRSALARGIGEQLVAVSFPPLWVCVIAPPVAVPTAAIFAAAELTRDTPSAKMNVIPEGYGRNDLQATACARYPDVATVLARLEQRSPTARMTGSGACAFAWFDTEAEAMSSVASVVGVVAGVTGFLARTLTRHPLAAFAC